jgi:hypothetical protein
MRFFAAHCVAGLETTSVSSTDWRSKVERLMTLGTVGGGGLLLQRFAQLVEEPRVKSNIQVSEFGRQGIMLCLVDRKIITPRQPESRIRSGNTLT